MQTFFWVSLALAFFVFVWIERGQQTALEYISGYLMEWSLSIDNIFVFILIFSSFKVKEQYYGRVLLIGILMAIFFRVIFITAGVALVMTAETDREPPRPLGVPELWLAPLDHGTSTDLLADRHPHLTAGARGREDLCPLRRTRLDHLDQRTFPGEGDVRSLVNLPGAAVALGVTNRVTSPSFLLRREYPGQIPVVHLDIYRLDTIQEVIDIGYDELVDRDRVTFIEWGDAMSPLLPTDYLEVDFRLADPSDAFTDGSADAEERTITLRARGEDWARRLAALSADLQPWRLVDGEGAD